MPEESGLGLDRSGPAGKQGGFCQGDIDGDSPKRSRKKPICLNWAARSVGALFCLQAHKYFGARGRPSRAASCGNVKRGADPTRGSNRWLGSHAVRSLPGGSFPRRGPPLMRSATGRGFYRRFFPSSKAPRKSVPCITFRVGTRVCSEIRIFSQVYGLTARLRAQWIWKSFHGRKPPNPSSLCLSYPRSGAFVRRQMVAPNALRNTHRSKRTIPKNGSASSCFSRAQVGQVGRTKPFTRSATGMYLQTVSKLS